MRLIEVSREPARPGGGISTKAIVRGLALTAVGWTLILRALGLW